MYIIWIIGVCLTLSFRSFWVNHENSTPTQHTVAIKGMQFVPAEITVKKGDIMVWTNEDLVEHNVTAVGKKNWASPPIVKGQSWKMVIKESSGYFCSLHPVMKGKILVQD